MEFGRFWDKKGGMRKNCTKITEILRGCNIRSINNPHELSTQKVDEKGVKTKLYTDLSTLSTFLNVQNVDFWG